MEEFLSQVRTILYGMGIHNVTFERYNWRWWTLDVNGLIYYCEQRGENIRIRTDGYRSFTNPKLAANYIVKKAPYMSRVKNAVELNKLFEGTNKRVGVTNEGYQAGIDCSKLDTINALFDCIEDNGFCESTTPERTTVESLMRQVRKILDKLPTDKKGVICDELIEELNALLPNVEEDLGKKALGNW